MSNILDKYLRITMPDGSKWAVPIRIIAESRAKFYADEFGEDVSRSLSEDTEPLFEAHPGEIRDWAAGDMNWSDVADYAVRCVSQESKVDYQAGWVRGEHEIVESVI